MKTELDKQLLLEGVDLLRDLVNAMYAGVEPKPQNYDSFADSYRRYAESKRNERPATHLTGEDFGNKRNLWPGECRSCGRPTYGQKYCADCAVMRGVE